MNTSLALRRDDRPIAYVESLPGQRSPETEPLHRRLMRLAFDVHDGPMQSLIGLSYGVRQLQQQMTDESMLDRAAVSRELDEMLEGLMNTEAALRTLIVRLEHGHPEIETIKDILDQQIDDFRKRHDAEVVAYAPPFQPDSASQAIAIKAVLREALSNVAKHSNATAVTIRIDPAPQGILVEIEDNGAGFDLEDTRSDALGLTSMRSRVEMLGGELTMLSRVGGPTVVSAHFERWAGDA